MSGELRYWSMLQPPHVRIPAEAGTPPQRPQRSQGALTREVVVEERRQHRVHGLGVDGVLVVVADAEEVPVAGAELAELPLDPGVAEVDEGVLGRGGVRRAR